jgi:hypothetical protein
MSGASALAAAKRRRAVATDVPKPMPPRQPQFQPAQLYQQQPQPQQPSALPQEPAPVPQPTPMTNPLNTLLKHEQKLNDIEEALAELQLDVKKPETLTPETLHFFKTQHDLLNQEIQELKKIIIKVQTFSMETNLELIRMKKIIRAEKEEKVEEPPENVA